MKTLIAILSFIILTTQITYARDWEKVKIPGAVCADGLPYFVFVNKKQKNENLLIEFMGGGACWSQDTCWGLNFRTWIHPIPEVPFFSYMTNDTWGWSSHPFRKDSALYFPYCTGDVFSADHVAIYDGFPVQHKGYRNVILALAYLKAKEILSFDKFKRVTVWGASAGAIATLVHVKNIDPYLSPKAKKYAIADSPGLHFGRDFWKKFTPELVHDYEKTFRGIGLEFTTDDGFLAPGVGPVLKNYSSWNIGVLQATRDRVMSNGFGEISGSEHRELILSDRGLAAIAKNHPNTQVWTTDSDMHTFLLLKATSYMDSMDNDSAIRFVKKLLGEKDCSTESSYEMAKVHQRL